MKWLDQIETPVETLIDDNIRKKVEEKVKNVKIAWYYKIFANLYILIPFAIITGPIVFLLFLQLDTQFSIQLNKEYFSEYTTDLYMWFTIFIALAVVFWVTIAFIVEKKKIRAIKKQISISEFFYYMSEKISNIELNGHREGPINSITNEPSEFLALISASAKMAFKGSYSVKGIVNSNPFELTTTRWIASNIAEHAPAQATWAKLKSWGYEGTYYSAISIKDDKFKDFNFIISTYLGKNKHNKTEISNDEFHKNFEIFGDAVSMHKLLNASEQDKYIKLRKNIEDFQVEIKNSILTITFQTPKGFNDPNYKKAKTSVKPQLILDSIDTTFIRMLDALSFVTCLRKVWE